MSKVTKLKKLISYLKIIDLGFMIAGFVCFILFLFSSETKEIETGYTKSVLFVSSVGFLILSSQRFVRRFFRRKRRYLDSQKREVFDETEYSLISQT